MTITDMFRQLGAPLANSRWSWGGVRPDGAVILRVWQDEVKRRDGVNWAQVTHRQEFAAKENDLGYQERNRHVALVLAGAACFLVMCEAKDPGRVPREIRRFNERELFSTGAVAEYWDNTWIALAERVPARP
jgi:hypothetical protein